MSRPVWTSTVLVVLIVVATVSGAVIGTEAGLGDWQAAVSGCESNGHHCVPNWAFNVIGPIVLGSAGALWVWYRLQVWLNRRRHRR
jgi:hypothetical protein